MLVMMGASMSANSNSTSQGQYRSGIHFVCIRIPLSGLKQTVICLLIPVILLGSSMRVLSMLFPKPSAFAFALACGEERMSNIS